jgi:hypothetical protein
MPAGSWAAGGGRERTSRLFDHGQYSSSGDQATLSRWLLGIGLERHVSRDVTIGRCLGRSENGRFWPKADIPEELCEVETRGNVFPWGA